MPTKKRKTKKGAPKNRRNTAWQTGTPAKSESKDKSIRAQKPSKAGEYRKGPTTRYQERRQNRTDLNPNGKTPIPKRPGGKRKRVKKGL